MSLARLTTYLLLICFLEAGFCLNSEASVFGRCLTPLISLFRRPPPQPERRDYRLEPDASISDPVSFRRDLNRAIGRGENLLNWPLFETQLTRMEEALPNGNLLRYEILRVRSSGRVSYDGFLDLFSKSATEISLAAGGTHYASDLTLTVMRNMREVGAILVPVVQNEPLSQLTILEGAVNGVFFLQLPIRRTRADGIDFYPDGFLWHDLQHSHDIYFDLLSPSVGPRQEFRSRTRPIASIVNRIRGISNDRLRQDLTAYLFEWIHEAPYLPSQRVFRDLHRAIERPNERLTNLTASLSNRDQESGAWRARLEAIRDWLRAEGFPEQGLTR